MHISSESLEIRSLQIEYSNGERQKILLDAASVGKALEVGFITYVATGGAPSAEIPVGIKVKNNITEPTLSAPTSLISGNTYTVVAAGPQDYTSVGGPAAGVAGDIFVSTGGALAGAATVRARTDYTALNPAAKEIDVNAEFEVTVPNRAFATASQAAFSISELLPRIVLV